jgi:hypothetical protein
MYSLTPLARTSIIVSWIAVGLACISTVVHFIALLIRRGQVRVPDFCVWLALIVGIVLVAQTTWAIVDEGSGRHQWDISQQNVAAIAKVSRRVVCHRYSTDANPVAHHQRDVVVYLWCFVTHIQLLFLANSLRIGFH